MTTTGIPEIIAAAKFFGTVYNNVRDADKLSGGFADTAKDLEKHLKSLSDALSGQKRIIEKRGAAHGADDYYWAIQGILGDFTQIQ